MVMQVCLCVAVDKQECCCQLSLPRIARFRRYLYGRVFILVVILVCPVKSIDILHSQYNMIQSQKSRGPNSITQITSLSNKITMIYHDIYFNDT